MTTWKQFKKEITILSPEETKLIDVLALLVVRRLELGITQEELAERIGMTQSRIARIEAVDSIPSQTILEQYANGIGFDTQTFFSSVEKTCD
ncbi:helix-turn-helix domain-containing protein [Ligilactobacillus equi]|uniref:HTH cro/C1-type domain-containing protein n=1 Tax=Ligilactobacillus equi DSM 15833 = JCM 10991 TaxID=1423740 RepID=A0A0R1TZL8_9LACO|nr:helix-turn-helix transcriptional regulator [Ligilactobacillus equi]KRL84296.1 hypothetical protein FC36_GL000218 [Ligilactobacillus equi DSM 15833 = JCM 10991]